MSSLLAVRPSPPVDTEFQSIVDELTRRGFLKGLAGTATVAALGACSSDAKPKEASNAGAVTRIFSSDKGSVRIPTNPRRVVCADFVTTDVAYDAGITPVGIDGKSIDYVVAAAVKKFAGIAQVRSAQSDLDLESIAALKPDLILQTTLTEKFYDQLTGIAPTVFITYSNGGGNWPDIERRFGDALGRVAATSALKDKYASATANIRSKHADVLAHYRWDLVDGDPDTWYLYSKISSHGKVLTDAGMRLGDTAVAMTKAFQPMSYEQIGVLDDAGAIGIGVTNTGKPTAGTQQLLSQKLFAGLPAVQAKRTFQLGPFFPVSYGAALALLDDFDRALDALTAPSKGTS